MSAVKEILVEVVVEEEGNKRRKGKWKKDWCSIEIPFFSFLHFWTF